MATATKKQVLTQQQFGGVPYGNEAALVFRLATNASGVWTDSDQATAVASGDKLRLGVLPAGMQLLDALAICSDLFTASVTCSIGIEAVDGTTTQDDADYFFLNTLALSAVGRTRATNTAVAPDWWSGNRCRGCPGHRRSGCAERRAISASARQKGPSGPFFHQNTTGPAP